VSYSFHGSPAAPMGYVANHSLVPLAPTMLQCAANPSTRPDPVDTHERDPDLGLGGRSMYPRAAPRNHARDEQQRGISDSRTSVRTCRRIANGVEVRACYALTSNLRQQVPRQ